MFKLVNCCACECCMYIVVRACSARSTWYLVMLQSGSVPINVLMLLLFFDVAAYSCRQFNLINNLFIRNIQHC